MSYQTHNKALANAKEARQAVQALIRSGEAPLDPETAAAMHRLNNEIAESEKVAANEHDY
jgi:hypothetical protein